MAVVIDRETEGQLALDYEFAFDIKKDNSTVAGEVVFSGDFTHEGGDIWQLEVKKADGNSGLLVNQSDLVLNCKLQLISTTSTWKIARIDAPYLHGRYVIRSEGRAMLFKSGDQQNLRRFTIEERNNLKIHVEVLQYTEAIPNPKRTIQIPKSTLPAEVLKWFESEDFGNVVIVAAGGKKFRCHRDVLSVRSEVFGRMFSCPLKESRENLVNIDGYNEEIIAALLEFLYVDNVDEIGPIADRLFAAAHQYELDRLKFLCESAMAANLSEENMVKTKKLAEFYQLDKLKAKCVDYVAIRKSKRFRKSSASNVADGPKTKRARPAEPTGLSITSNIVDNEETDIEGFYNDFLQPTHAKRNIFPTDCKFAFTIHNISTLGEVVFSHNFTHGGNLWQLEVEKSCGKDVRCQLHLVQTCCERIKMACVLHIVDTQYYFRDQDEFLSLQSTDRPGVKFDVTRVTPVALFRHSGDTFDFGRLKIGSDDADAKLEVQLVKWKSAETPAETTEPTKSQLVSEVLSWFQREDFGDLIIVAKDGTKFRCHRDILARRSEVLKRKINSAMQKAGEHVVTNEEIGEVSKAQVPIEVLNTKDFDGEIVAQLLLFIYIDKCGKIESIADRLCIAAHQYGLDRLKNLCESVLAVSLSPDTFMKAYLLARNYHLNKLMAVCVDYLDVHKAVLPVGKIFFEATKIQDGNGGQQVQK